MSVFKSFSKLDRRILGGSLVILLALSYLLYDDSLLFPKARNGDMELIGTIATSNNDVRRKNFDNFIWFPGTAKDEVYNKDSIFTGDSSKASIQLKDGSLIQIQENSLVQLNVKNGQMQLDLRFGQFIGAVPTNSTLQIKAGDEEYQLNGKDSKIEINRAKSGELDLKVLSGDVEISGKNGKQVVKPQEALQIGKKGAVKSDAQTSVTLLTENNISYNRAQEKDPLPLEWESKGPLAQYQIEVSKIEDFKRPLISRFLTDQNVLIKDPLAEGSYFWRVKAVDANKKTIVTSESRKFKVSMLAAPKILSPDDQAILKTTKLPTPEGLTSTTEVSWEADERLTSFEWQLSRDPDFAELVTEKSLDLKSTETPALGSGTYYTRVRGKNKDQVLSPWSTARIFKFDVQGEKKPPAPRLIEDRIQFQMPKLEGRAPSAENSPKMAWTQVPQAVKYNFELAKNRRFVGSAQQNLERTNLAWTDYKPGKYYFRVRAQSQLGQMSDYSNVGVLEVLTDRPILNAIPSILIKETNLDAKAPPKEVKTSWTGVNDAKSYVVQIDRNQEFENPQQMEVAETDRLLTLPEPGKYFVRVKALNESGQDMTEFSNVQDVTYTFMRTLNPPELLEPYDKATLFMQKETEPFIWLEWNAVKNADRYFLEVSSTADFSNTLIRKEQNSTRFLMKEKIPYGSLYWRVRAISREADLSSEWSARQFMFYHQKNRGF